MFYESPCFESPGQDCSYSLANFCGSPCSFWVDSSFGFKAKLFHPPLCSAGIGPFAISHHLTCRGLKQRKYWKMGKIYMECTWKHTSLFLANASSVFTALPGCLMEWFTNDLWLQPQRRPGQSREKQHGAELWLQTAWPAPARKWPSNEIHVSVPGCALCVFYMHVYSIIFTSSSLTAVKGFF